MGTNDIIRKSLVATIGVAGLTLSACSSSGQHHDRYGSIYDYESGGSCDAGRYGACDAVISQPAPAPMAAPVTGVVYADCSAIGDMNCGYSAPAPAPAPVYSEPSYTGTTYSSGSTYSSGMTSGGMAECPAGTTMQSDGTCMQTSSYSSGGYTSTTTTTSTYSSGEVADCPAGTVMQSDGTCMQSSSSYTSTYSSSSSSSMGSAVVCPAGTVMQGDGSCMESSSSTYTGYSSSGGYSSSDYLPIRK